MFYEYVLQTKDGIEIQVYEEKNKHLAYRIAAQFYSKGYFVTKHKKDSARICSMCGRRWKKTGSSEHRTDKLPRRNKAIKRGTTS